MDAAARRLEEQGQVQRMRTNLEPWQVTQLQRLAAVDPERIESALNDLWEIRPDILEQVVTSAVEQEQLSLDRGAKILDVDMEVVERLLADFRRRGLKRCCVVVTEGSVAKLADGGLPVWEVVRVYRKLGSLELLHEAFSGVSPQTLESALAYADQHPDEIDRLIERYEALIVRRKAEYPFAR